MHITDEKIQKILTDFCGDPPDLKRVQYHIWVNQEKLDFYSKSNGFEKGKELADSLDSYRRMIEAGKKLLKTIPHEQTM